MTTGPHHFPKIPLLLINSAAQLFGDKAKENIFDQAKADLMEEYIENLQSRGPSFAATHFWYHSVVFVAVASAHLFLRPVTKLLSKIIS